MEYIKPEMEIIHLPADSDIITQSNGENAIGGASNKLGKSTPVTTGAAYPSADPGQTAFW